MGNVSSRSDEGSSVFLRDQSRFAISSVLVANSRDRTLLQINPAEFPAARYLAKREAGNDAPVEWVQDPDSPSQAPPTFLLRLSNEDDLIFTFTFSLRRDADTIPASNAQNPVPDTADTVVNGLTFLFAPSQSDLDHLIKKELHADPNMHKNNPSVHLIGDFSTAGTPYAQSQWTWRWQPPKPTEDFGGGWRTCCSFVEYDQRTHKLSPLATFVFWVQNNMRSIPMPNQTSPRIGFRPPSRLRVPSAQSVDSRVSDSDTDTPLPLKDVQPPSPTIEAIPEDGLGLFPSQSISTSSTAVASKVDLCQRPGEDVSAVEDGPLFRATLKAMEQKTGNMRARWKKVLKRAEAAVEAQKAHNNAVADLVGALREASISNANAIQPAMEIYFDMVAKDILRNDRQNVVNLEKMLINPISRLYNNDIKAVEAKKRDFDEESKDYYAFLSRYLGQRSDSLKDKKRQDTDKKYQDRRRNFELRRFDYSAFMQDLHGGRKDQEVLSHLTRYADAHARGYLATAKKIEEIMPQLDALTNDVNQANRDFQIHRTEREEKRRAIEKSTSGQTDAESAIAPPLHHSNSTSSYNNRPTPDSEWPRSMPTSHPTPNTANPPTSMPVPIAGNSHSTSAVPQAPALGTSPGSSRFKGYRDLEEKGTYFSGEAAAHRKEGLVWALSRPGSHVDPKGLNKQAWHKFWIVLDGGKLSEYTNWKQKLDLHMDPIDLRVASVREARNADRRFCFEIITPQFTRVYQATNEDDMKAWIYTINNALQSAVEGKGLSSPVPTEGSSSGSIRKDIASVLTGKSASTGHRNSYSSGSKVPHRHATVAERPVHRHVENPENTNKLLQQLRDADGGNQSCADCGSDQKVDWVSINLGIIICIECSGIHRSLGTHISKVRSLTLDPNAFTVDVVELLLKLGNRVANTVWEAKLDRTLKPTSQSTREQRLHFITAKYAERQYVQELSPTLSAFSTADETLLAAIKKNDIQSAIYGLALQANPNLVDRSRSTHAVFLALAAADPAAPSPISTPRPSTSSRPPTATELLAPNTPHVLRKAFPIAELLLLNGADLPVGPAPIPLSTSARTYLENKAEQKSGRKPLPAGVKLADDTGIGTGGDTLTALPNIRAGNGTSVREREKERERSESERMRKRVSSSGRLTKPMPAPSAGPMFTQPRSLGNPF